MNIVQNEGSDTSFFKRLQTKISKGSPKILVLYSELLSMLCEDIKKECK